MCGLVGVYISEKTPYQINKLKSAFKELLYADALRGRHGTGLLKVGDKGTARLYKKAVPAEDFMQLKGFKDVMDEVDGIAYLGHNRFATRGEHTDVNSHPFINNSIALFHNGTVHSFQHLVTGSNKTFVVDSDAISYAVSVCNSLKDVGTVLGKIYGAYALVWYDVKHGTINFARNSERPLFIGKVSKSESFLYASEKDMITWIASRNKVDLEEIEELPTGVIRSIKVIGKSAGTIVEESLTPTRAVNFSSGGYGDFPDYDSYPSYKNQTWQAKKTTTVIKIDTFEPYANTQQNGKVLGVSIDPKYQDKEFNIGGIHADRGKELVGKYALVTSSGSYYKDSIFANIDKVLTEEEVFNWCLENDIDVSNGPEDDEDDELDLIEFTGVVDSTKKDRIYIRGAGKLMTTSEIDDLLSDGCAFCNGRFNALSDIIWYNGYPLCKPCDSTIS